MGAFEAVYRRSLENPAGFYRWFVGGALNTCHNALDRHVEGGRGSQVALVYDSPVTSTVQTFTYRELRAEVARFAGALAARGVGKGDRVVISMPRVPQAVIAMLACARIGAIHSVVFGGFAADELATDPLYILYTSGTIAQPKGVVRDNGGHAVALRWSMTNIYDTGPGEVYWAASEMEEVIASHRDVAECAVVGVRDDLKGQVPLGFVVLTAGVERDHSQLEAELVQMVRDQIGPVAGFKRARVVGRPVLSVQSPLEGDLAVGPR